MRRRVDRGVLAALLVVAVLCTACTGSSSTALPLPTDPTTSSTVSPTASSTEMESILPIGYNPCYKLRTPPVVELLGTDLIKSLGHAGQRRCAMLPTTTGDPVLTVTYQPYDLGLDELLEGLGEDPATVARPTIAHAADARLLVSSDSARLFTTGFVLVNGIVEVVNGADPPPNDRTRLVAATEEVMRQLAATAPTMSPTPTTSPSGSPSPSASPSVSAE